MQLLDALLEVQVRYKIHVPSRDSAPCFKNAGGGYLLLPRSLMDYVFRAGVQQGRAVSRGTAVAVVPGSQAVLQYK